MFENILDRKPQTEKFQGFYMSAKAGLKIPTPIFVSPIFEVSNSELSIVCDAILAQNANIAMRLGVKLPQISTVTAPRSPPLNSSRTAIKKLKEYKSFANTLGDDAIVELGVHPFVAPDPRKQEFSGSIITTFDIDKKYAVMQTLFGFAEGLKHWSADRYVLNKSTGNIDTKIANKLWCTYINDWTGEICRYPVTKHKFSGERICLNESQAKSMFNLAEMFEAMWGPAELDFSTTAGETYFIDSRPIQPTGNLALLNARKYSLKTLLQPISGVVSSILTPEDILHAKTDLLFIPNSALQGEHRADVPLAISRLKAPKTILVEAQLGTTHTLTIMESAGHTVLCVDEQYQNGTPLTIKPISGNIIEVTHSLENIIAHEIEIPHTKTKVFLNISDAETAHRYAALSHDGFGLVRMEYLIAKYVGMHPQYVIDNKQEDSYIETLSNNIAKIASAAYPRPAVIRFSDFSEDKLRFLKGGENYERELKNDNSIAHCISEAFGFRGCVRYLYPKTQQEFLMECEAIKNARKRYDNIDVMLPMVRIPSDIQQVIEVIEKNYNNVIGESGIWIMGEVAAVLLDPKSYVHPRVKGISIGTNDLTQSYFNVFRDYAPHQEQGWFEHAGYHFQNPMLLPRLIKTFKDAGKAACICGDLASKDMHFVEAMSTQGASLSVSPSEFSTVKHTLAKCGA